MTSGPLVRVVSLRGDTGGCGRPDAPPLPPRDLGLVQVKGDVTVADRGGVASQAVQMERTGEMSAAAEETAGDGTRFIAFHLANVIHELPAEVVREVLAMVIITPLPDAPAWLTGVINRRGTIIPVIDLRIRIGFAAGELELSTPILVVEHDGRSIGLIADAIDQIITVPRTSIQAPDELMQQSRLVDAVIQRDSRPLVVMNLDVVCAGTEQFTGTSA